MALLRIFRAGHCSLGGKLARAADLTRRRFSGFSASDAPSAVFASYRIYKKSSLLSLTAIGPTMKEIPGRAGGQGYALTVDRPGTILLEFVPAMGERQFDYANKEIFALSATECGEFVAKTSSGAQVKFIHDTGKFQGMSQGSISTNSAGETKRVSIDPMKDGDGFFFTYNSDNQNISVPVTAGEYIVTRQLMLHSIPHLLGFDALFKTENTSPRRDVRSSQAVNQGQVQANDTVFNPFNSEDTNTGGKQQSGSKSSRPSSNWLDEL